MHKGNKAHKPSLQADNFYLIIQTHFVSQDIETLKRSLHYAKHVLQADYENKLQERALDL